jgi:hypothetical protein
MKFSWQTRPANLAKALLCGGMLLLAVPSAVMADSKMDQIFNDEAIQRYLGEVDPAVGYLTRLKMMKSHLAASILNLNAGRQADASTHVAHPMKEIWTAMEPAMKPTDAHELKAALLAAQNAVGKHDNAEIVARVDEANTILLRLETEAVNNLKDKKMLADVVAVLLRTAVVEYHEAFDGKTIKNLVEYHDGAYFVLEAQAILASIGPALQAKDANTFAEMNVTLNKLYSAWSITSMPEKIASVTRLQSLVTVAEIKLSALR